MTHGHIAHYDFEKPNVGGIYGKIRCLHSKVHLPGICSLGESK